jgi:thiol-disulfide isomerase/thioredoxin
MKRPDMPSWRGRMRALPIAVGALFVLACDSGRTAPASSSSAASSASTSPPSSSAQAASPPLVLSPAEGIRWTQAPSGVVDASSSIHEALAAASAEGRTLLVYVGATWCEPCQRFHHAVEQGELDAAFPRLSVLAFDADRDAEPLAAAGYFSRLIPLFAIPKGDGRSSGKQIEGSVKGETAVGEITPRLRALLSGT